MQWGLRAARTPCRDRHNCHYTNKLTWKKTPVWDGREGTDPVRPFLLETGRRAIDSSPVASDEAIINNDVG